MGYRSVLFLDDLRVPTATGVDHVRSFAEFVEYLRRKGVPDLISFDHDLAREHYPVGMNRAGERIRYDEFREATGMHCARYVVEQELDLRYWTVHSANVQGKRNIERELRAYRPDGEVRGVEIPFVVRDAELEPAMSAARAAAVASVAQATPGVLGAGAAPPLAEAGRARFSATSLLQFDEAFAQESWKGDVPVESASER